MLYGVKNVLGNLDKAERAGRKAAERGITKAAMATAAHIKKEFRREVSGKGFQNRSGMLRASIRSEVRLKSNEVIGYVIAGWGGTQKGKKSYAPYVEFRWSGKYAYLWPGVKAMKKKIEKIITDEMKGAI